MSYITRIVTKRELDGRLKKDHLHKDEELLPQVEMISCTV